MFRSTKVAAIFDFDKTLSPQYMQKVIFDAYQVDEDSFWVDCRKRSKENEMLFGGTHHEVDYMATMLSYVKNGKFLGLTNEKLKSLGETIPLYPGVAWMFNEIWKTGAEIYIISSGIKTMLGTLEGRIQREINNADFRISGIYGGDFREDENGLCSIANCISAMDKTRFIYEISKGCNIYNFDVTTSVPIGGRRVPLENIIYVGDGPSDVWVWNLIKDSGGYTMGVFNPEFPSQFELVENIRKGNRLDTVAVADYREGSTAASWILGKIKEMIKLSSEEYMIKQRVTTIKRPGY